MASQTLSFGARLGPRPTVAIFPTLAASPMRNPAVSVVSAHCTGTDTDKGRPPTPEGAAGCFGTVWARHSDTASDLHALHTLHDGTTHAVLPLELLSSSTTASSALTQ
jgi:hypothetical protein